MNELTLEIVQTFLRENQLDLQSTHTKVCFPILKRIHDKLLQDQRFAAIKAENSIIIDGHHRYICLSILGLEIETIKWTKSPSTEVISWDRVEIVEEDWETEQQIKNHNKICDAIKNDVAL